MNRIVNAVSVVVITAAATAACGRELDLEQVPVGSEVALTREDGGVVQGTLKEQDAATVKVETGRTVRTVPKTTIAAVQVVEPSAPLELPAEAKFREYTIPAGTALTIRLVSGLDSKTTPLNAPVSGALTTGVVVDGVTVAPSGSVVSGVVSAVEPAGKVKGRASMSLAFRTLMVEGHDAPYTVVARRSFQAASTKKEDAAKIGVPAVGGAIIGGILGGKKGAVIGGVVGGGAGTAVVLTTTGDEVELPAGTALQVELAQPVDVRVPIKK